MGFALAVLPLIVTPGASLTLLAQRVATGGLRKGLPVILGTATGLYLHASLAILGLSALIIGSSRLFLVVRFLGAIYLIGLGVWTWRQATRPPNVSTSMPATPSDRAPSTYVPAVLANVLNPKAASIPLSITPQFLDPDASVGGQILLFTTMHALLSACWLLLWTLILGRGAGLLHSARAKAMFNRAAGAMLLALGLRAAVGE